MKIDEANRWLRSIREDPEALCQFYLDLLDHQQQIHELKRKTLSHIESILENDDLDHGETDIATYGMTNPKPSVKIDKKEWKEAIETNPDLADLQREYERAQLPFMVDATQSPRPYIRKKRK